MLKRWNYYLQLGWLDLVRLWPTTRHHAIIVAGICLPIMMLLGIKRGHVAALRRDLVTSPIGRQITFWSARKGELMNREVIERLSGELPHVDLMIPETQRVVRLSRRIESENNATEFVSATIYATRHGDPQFVQLGINAPRADQREIILGEGLAGQLQVNVGDTIDLRLNRGRDAQEEERVLTCHVSSVIATEQQNALIGYMDLDLLDAFEQYVRGQRVEGLDWPSANSPAQDGYSSYLVFCEKANDLTDDDLQFFADRGFQLTECTDAPPAPIARLLVTDFRQSLRIYQATTTQLSKLAEPRLHFAPSEFSEQTRADDVVLPWNVPDKASFEDQNWIVVGISLPRRTWLREYFVNPTLPFDYDADPFQAHSLNVTTSTQLKCDLHPSGRFAIECLPVTGSPSAIASPNLVPSTDVNSQEPTMNRDGLEPNHDGNSDPEFEQPIAVVPANLCAWLAAYRTHLVDFDSSIRLFVPLPQAPVYDRARLYAQTIDDVPIVAKALTEKNFAVMSETGRIAEIHRQDGSLQLLVWIVGTGVFLFGIVTIISVLMDSTDRKRGTIGILRVMGVSPGGIFVSILVRSAIIGLLAAALSLACGFALAVGLEWKPAPQITWLAWKPVVHIELDVYDLAIVAAGALVCCSLGALPPAWKASRLDPFDAIVEGRFR